METRERRREREKEREEEVEVQRDGEEEVKSVAVPDEYRVTWLNLWNNSLNPKEVSCRLAVDTLFYCFGPAYQFRHIYQQGMPSTCDKQREDVKLCALVKAKQFQTREEIQAKLHESRDVDLVREPHVWPMRDAPPVQFNVNSPFAPSSRSQQQL